MLNHLINLRWPTTAVFSDDSVTKRSNQYLDLKTEEWNISTKTVNVCEPSDIPTTFFNYVGNPPLFCVFLSVLDEVHQFKNEVSEEIRNFDDLNSDIILVLCSAIAVNEKIFLVSTVT